MLLVWQTDIWNLFSRKPHNCHVLETTFLHNCTCFAVWFGLTQWKCVCRKQRLESLEKFWLALCFKALKTSSNFTVPISVHKWMQCAVYVQLHRQQHPDVVARCRFFWAVWLRRLWAFMLLRNIFFLKVTKQKQLCKITVWVAISVELAPINLHKSLGSSSSSLLLLLFW